MSRHKFFPKIEPYNHFLLDVGNDHQIYVEQCGNPDGLPVLFIHGGPGGGCSSKDRRFFDPDVHCIILFDQRGCGRSLPHGCLTQNETHYLVADIEKIREKLNVQKWHVFGGSWGSTLALVYAQSYPTRVISMILRGIFLARQEDMDWTFSAGGATRIFPDYWQDFQDVFPVSEEPFSIQMCYNILIGDDKELAIKIARAWSLWEIRCCRLQPNEEFVATNAKDETCWTLARHEAHYMVNGCFLAPNQILENSNKIAHIPIIIVHGRYDIVCPFDNAWALQKFLPESELIISETAGHASSEPETLHHLISATKKLFQAGYE